MRAFRRVPNDSDLVYRVGRSSKEITYHLKFRNPLNHPSAIFKKKSVLLSGGYPSNIPIMEDYGLWLKMTHCGCKPTGIRQVLVDYRVGTKSILRSRGISHLKSEIKIYEIKRQLGFTSGLKGLGVFIARVILPRSLPAAKIVEFIYSYTKRNWR